MLFRNNWFTVQNKVLSFINDGKTYVARWRDIEAVYNGNRKNSICLTKITYTGVYPKPLQGQSVSFVCQIFNDKTVAALSTLKDKLGIIEGTIIFVKLISDWFHMMNVKVRYSGINMRDECCQPWTMDCTSFKKISGSCDVISSCAWAGGKGRTQKLTKQTAKAFVLSTRSNIQAAELLLHNFDYVLPGLFADEALKMFLGQQRSGWKFYIDIIDIKAAAHLSRDVPCTSNICIDDDQFDITIALPTFALMTINLTSLLLTLKT